MKTELIRLQKSLWSKCPNQMVKDFFLKVQSKTLECFFRCASLLQQTTSSHVIAKLNQGQGILSKLRQHKS